MLAQVSKVASAKPLAGLRYSIIVMPLCVEEACMPSTTG